jgi:hypothetical protein
MMLLRGTKSRFSVEFSAVGWSNSSAQKSARNRLCRLVMSFGHNRKRQERDVVIALVADVRQNRG